MWGTYRVGQPRLEAEIFGSVVSLARELKGEHFSGYFYFATNPLFYAFLFFPIEIIGFFFHSFTEYRLFFECFTEFFFSLLFHWQ